MLQRHNRATYHYRDMTMTMNTPTIEAKYIIVKFLTSLTLTIRPLTPPLASTPVDLLKSVVVAV